MGWLAAERERARARRSTVPEHARPRLTNAASGSPEQGHEARCMHLAEYLVGQSGTLNEYGRPDVIVECLYCGQLRRDDEIVFRP